MANWHREEERIRKHYGEGTTLFHEVFLNKTAYCGVIHCLLIATIYWFLGWYSVLYQFTYASLGIFFLGFGNYFQHYGL